jgi:hypothetical protein
MTEGKEPAESPEGERQRRASDRRRAEDRRKADRRLGMDRRAPHAHYDDLTRHPRPERNINDYPLSTDEVEFINAITDYKEKFTRPFPTWSEILHVMRTLGYTRLPEEILSQGAEVVPPVTDGDGPAR